MLLYWVLLPTFMLSLAKCLKNQNVFIFLKRQVANFRKSELFSAEINKSNAFMIDCHCHLADEAFADDLDAVIRRAKDEGVVGAVVVPEFATDFPQVLALSDAYPGFIFPCLGVHPIQKGFRSVNLDSDFVGAEEQIRKNSSKIVGVGEVGLDYSPRFLKDKDVDRQNQLEVLRRQAELANELDLPLNVHSRSASRPVIDALVAAKVERALLHAFDGSVKNAVSAINAGFHFSVPPSFTLSEAKRALIARIPLEQLCLETDSPVLGTSREERNEPKNVFQSAEFVADVKNLPVEEIVRVTTQNAKRLFRIGRQFMSEW